MLREFADTKGTTWQVFDVYPVSRGKTPTDSTEAAHLPDKGLNEGWLCFQCDNEKRRLAPIPLEWEICACAELEVLCSRAGFASRTLANPH